MTQTPPAVAPPQVPKAAAAPSSTAWPLISLLVSAEASAGYHLYFG